MSATLLLKRTLGTSPPNIAPVGTGVSFGELVYTYDTSDVGAGKSYKKLYIGNPAGPTAAPIVIGGEYYTSLIPESPANYGNREASKALILDANAKVKSWSVITDFHNAGVGTNQGDFYVGGNLNVTGDLVYDEVTGRNINITGVGTIATIFNTKATIVDGAIDNLYTVSGLVTTLTGTSANYVQVNVGHALTANNVEITGITTLTNNLDFSRNLIKIGRETASGISSADGSIFIGDYAATGMGQSTSNRRNIAIGASALQNAGTGNNADELESNIVVGNFAGYRLQGTKNLMVGDKVGFALSSSGNDENIALGNQAMYGDTFPVVDGVTLSISIGQQTAIANHDESTDVTETSGSGEGLIVRLQTGATGLVTGIDVISPGDGYVLNDTFTIPFGFQTLTGTVSSINGRFLSGGTGARQQSKNIAIGPYSLFSVDGSRNIAIGYSAGDVTTGSGNVIIGYERDVAIAKSDNQLTIGSSLGNWIDGNQLGYVGIGTTRPFGLLDVGGVLIVDKGTGNTVISGVTTVPTLDVDNLGIEDIKVTAGLATDFAITNAKIQSGIITDTVGAAATITNVDFVNADILAAKITAGIVTDLVGTGATIAILDTETADLSDVKITSGVITSIVGTYATITTFDSDDADINVLKTVTGVVTSLTGFGVTYNTADFEFVDASDIKITTGLVTSLVGTYVTFQDADFQDDVRVGGALTVVGDLTVQGNTSFVQSSVIQVTDKNIELGFSSTGNHADATADNGGIILKGSTDKTIQYNTAREAWESNLKWNPTVDDTLDIGEPTVQWRDIYIDGTAHLDAADILDAKITAGVVTDLVGTHATITVADFEQADIVTATIQSGIVTDINVSAAATINTSDLSDADIKSAKITAGIITSLVGTYGTITTLDVETLDAQNISITGVAVTDIVGTAATITTIDAQNLDAVNAKITVGIITDIVGTAATIATIDATEGDIVNAKITAGVVTSLVGTYATITVFDAETLDAKNTNITGLAVTDIVGTAATITTIDATEGDIVNAKITAGVVTSIVGTYATITVFDTETADLKDVKITSGIITDIVGTAATITTIDAANFDAVNAKINAGYVTSLYDSTGVVGINTQHILSTNPDGTITWREPAQIGIATVNPGADVWFVDTHGVDDNEPSRGRTDDRPFKTIKYALSRISNKYPHTYNGGTATDAVNVQSGAESGNQKSPNGATYNEHTGELILSFGSAHGLSTADTITLDNNSISFTCTKDNNATSHTYPRVGDPIAGVTTAVTVINSTSFSLNVGVSPLVTGENETLNIGGGVYEEIFPLYVPAGVTVKGNGLRATKVVPTTATKQKDAFLLNDRSVVEDMTIADMFFNTATNEGFAFKYEPGIAITSRSPYVQRVTVLNKGSNVTATDPYGYASADSPPSSYISGGGAYIDGSEVQSGSLEAAMLFNECTFIVPNSQGVVMTNGARVEYLNAFTYFSSEAIKGISGTAGISSTGQTRLRLSGITTVGVGNTITVFDTDGTTGLGTAVVASYDGTYLGVTGKQTGFEVLNARTAKSITFNDGAQLDTTVKKFGSAALKLDGSNDSISVPSSGDLGFGTNTDFTVEFWAYSNTTGLSSATLFDLRDNGSDTNGLSLAYRAAGEVDLRVGTTTAITGSGAGIATGVWKHYAIARGGTNTRLFVDGTQRGIKTSDTTDYGASKGIVFGADFDGASNNVTGWIDEVRIERGVAKYTANFTAPTTAPTGDKDTVLLLHFDGSTGIKTTTDDVIRNQDIRITQPNSGVGTATKVILADYSQFGADMRSVGCAVEYGQKGVVADGDGVSLRMFALNFNHVGAGGDITNDPNLAIQANEVTEVNGGDVSYVSIDQKGDFRVGEAFYVDQENGTVSFSQQVTSLQALSSLVITDGTDSSTVTPTSGTFGNIQIAGNNIESTSGDINIDPAGSGDINITGDVNVLGILTATTIQLDAFQKGDTSVALSDSGSDGTIRLSTDNVEAMRVDANQKIGIGTAAVRDRLDVLDTARFERINVTGVSTFAGAADFNGDIDVDGHTELDDLNVSGVGTIATFDTETADLKTVKITSGIATDLVGTAATITTIDVTEGDILNAKINAGVITSLTLTDSQVSGIVTYADNAAAHFGDGGDLKIYHNPSFGSYIDDSGTGALAIRSNEIQLQKYTGETLANFTADGSVKLFHNNGPRLETLGAGVSVSGELQTGTLLVATDAVVSAGMTVVGITTFNDDVFIAGNLNVIGDLVYDETNSRNLNVSGIATIAAMIITGVTTSKNIQIGTATSTTKITTTSGKLVLESFEDQVDVNDNLQVVGYGTFRDGLYYPDSANGIGYSGPNGIAYFDATGKIVSGLSTVGFLTVSEYVLTTNASGNPIWSNSIDGGTF